MTHIWILESEEETLSIYGKMFAQGFETRYFTQLDQLQLALQNPMRKPALLIANLNLPDGKFEDHLMAVCRSLDIPFAVVSEVNDASVINDIFERGALDFLVKPVSGNEVLFKVTRLIEKSGLSRSMPSPKFRELTLDSYDQQVSRDRFSSVISLTQIEYKILALLFTKASPRLERRKIIARVWERTVQSSRVFDFHLSKLREKLRKVSVRIELAKEGYCLLLE